MNTLTPAQVAKAMGVHRTSISRRCAAGTIRAYRLPGNKTHWHIEADEVARLRVQPAK
jgi:excisionase family DNA binding protein